MRIATGVLCLGLVCLPLSGCIAGDTALSELSQDDWEKVCKKSNIPEEDIVTECDGATVTISATTVEECASDSYDAYRSCSATVDEYYACQDAILADPCNFIPEECLEVAASCN